MRELWSIILRAIRWGRRDCIDCAKDTINYSKTGNIYYIIRKSISKIAILLLILLSFSLKRSRNAAGSFRILLFQ